MNNRIKEIESQCWEQVACDFDMSEGGLSTIRPVFNRAKFAKLIVEECATIANRAENNDLELRCMYNIITEHFGVK
jgi:hypothetical protein